MLRIIQALLLLTVPPLCLVQQDSATLQEGALPIHLACRRADASFREIKYLVDAHDGDAMLGTFDSNGFLPLHSLCGSTGSTLETIEYL